MLNPSLKRQEILKGRPMEPFDSVDFGSHSNLSCNPFDRVVANTLCSSYSVKESTLQRKGEV